VLRFRPVPFRRFTLVLAAPLVSLSLASIGFLNCASCAKAQAPASADASSQKMEAFEEKIPGTDAKFKMVPIPGGTFTMGSPDSEKDRKDDEGPQHEVQVDPFFFGEHVVTWGEYNLFLDNYNRLSSKPPVTIPNDKLADAVTYPTPMYDVEAAPKLERMGGRGPEFPAVIMSQFAARQYTKWLSKKTGRFYRLPSEAEWEYAARAGTKTAYFFGDDPAQLGDYAWFNKNSNEKDGDTGYHPIMQKKPNPWGLYDIYGNVSEWCVDQYDEKAYTQFAGKTTNWKDTIVWPVKQYPRVLRGGFYDSEASECRSASRAFSNKLMNAVDPQLPKSPHWMSDGFFIGFRVLSPVKEPSEEEKARWWNVDDPITAEVIKRDRERKELVTPASGN
jgi:formylglycine-generating enzyme required for sulfatase activity